MDSRQFDRLSRLVGQRTGRRAAVLGVLGAVFPSATWAKDRDGQATRVAASKCVADNTRCGKGEKEKCADCCSGYAVEGPGGNKRCRCKTGGMACDGPRECCSGACRNGKCAPPPTPTSCSVCASGCPWSTIQAALDAANSGETITVAPGTWSSPTSLTVSKDITLQRCGDSGTVTLTQPDAATGPILVVDAATPGLATFRNLNFFKGAGGGLFSVSTQGLNIEGCTFDQIPVPGGTGAVRSWQGPFTMTDTTISDTTGLSIEYGLGLSIRGVAGDEATITNCTISGNTNSGTSAGGVQLSGAIDVTFVDSEIIDNSSVLTGAIDGMNPMAGFFTGKLTLNNTRISGNVSTGTSPGAIFPGVRLSESDVTVSCTNGARICNNPTAPGSPDQCTGLTNQEKTECGCDTACPV